MRADPDDDENAQRLADGLRVSEHAGQAATKVPADMPVKQTAPELRPYQVEIIEKARERLSTGGRKRIILVCPTGGGKTVVSAQIILNSLGKDRRALFLVHRRELLKQAASKLSDVGIDVGIIAPGFPPRPSQPVQVASIATLHSRGIRTRRMDLPEAHLIVVDECHHATAATWKSILDAYPEAFVVGLTATPCRGDGRGLGSIFEELVECPDVSELARQGYLVGTKVFAAPPPDLSGVKILAGDYNEKQLSAKVNTNQLVGDVVTHWLRFAEGRRTLVYAVDVAHSVHLRDEFCRAGISAGHIDGTTPAEERDEVLRQFGAGVLDVVTNCAVLTEGFDAPEASCIVLAKPTKSFGLYRQMCLDSITEILTQRGWLGPDEIRDDDQVCAFDQENGAAGWVPILSRVDRTLGDDEGMMGVNSPGVDLRVTAEHQMVFCTRSLRQWRKKEAMAVAALRNGWGIPVSGQQSAPGLALTNDELRFIGWFVTDGCLNKKNNVIQIAQAENKIEALEIEKCLQGCGFKYGKHVRWPNSQFNATARRIEFYVSKGKPRDRDKHLSGWGRLEPYIDKDLSPALEDISAEQLAVLLEAIHLGDGWKHRGQSWTRRSYHIATGNLTFADRLQSLCVRRGWRCNRSIQSYNKNPLYALHIKKSALRWIGGPLYQDRDFLKPVKAIDGERVWCVENKLGTLFIRRNGKVAVVGNCGRGLRPAPNKQNCIIIDHAGLTLEHGFVDEPITWALSEDHKAHKKLEGGGSAGQQKTLVDCPECGAARWKGKPCPACGWRGHKNGAGVDFVDAELAELTRERKAKEYQPPLFIPEEFYRQLLWVVRERSYSPGWAAHKYREKFGVWPTRSWQYLAPMEPAAPTRSWIRSRQIAWAKSRHNPSNSAHA